jgi:hypothetical protein
MSSPYHRGAAPVVQTFNQLLDHTNPSSPTFPQR